MRKILPKFIITIFCIIIAIFILQNSTLAAGIDGTTIVLNPGHGGKWTGCANGSRNLVEKNITLKIANYLKEYLEQYYNTKVILTHDGINFPNNDPEDLAARAMIARNNNADLYVSLHIDDSIDKSQNGATIYVTSRTELPKYKEGMTKLAQLILANLNKLGIATSKFGIVNNKLCNDRLPRYQYYDGSQADYYADIRHAMRGDSLDDLGTDFRDGSGIPTVLIEHCYMNNIHDVEFLDSEEDLNNLAKADGEAIVQYLGLRKNGSVVNKLSVDKENINLLLDKTEKINITEIGPSSATNKQVKWTSSDEKIAKVEEDGNIIPVSEGQATIMVTSVDNKNISKNIKVNVEKQEVKFEDNIKAMLVGKKIRLNVKITPTWIENKNIIWESSNNDIITVSESGEIEAKKEGKATIKVTWKDKNLSDEIEINAVELDEKDTKIEIKNYKQENNYISKIGEKVSKEEFLKNIKIPETLEIQIESDKETIGTGTKVKIIHKASKLLIEEYTCLIYGDVNGDGKISSLDYTLIKNHIMDVKKITDKNQSITANVNGDAKISSLDYTLIKNHIMDVKQIEEK